MTMQFFNLGKARQTEVERLISVRRKLAALDAQKKELEAEEAELKDVIKEEMKANNVKTYDNGIISITLKDGYIRHDFDKERFRAYNAELYNKYLKDVEVNGSMLIKIKG